MDGSVPDQYIQIQDLISFSRAPPPDYEASVEAHQQVAETWKPRSRAGPVQMMPVRCAV